MEIRPLTFEAYDSIIVIWQRADLSFRIEGRDSRKMMRREFENNPDLIIGAFEKGELVGVIIGTDDGRKGWINRLAVEPNFRRKGVAKELISALEEALKKRGRRIFCTLVEDWNKASLSLFKNAGYLKHEDIFYLSKRENEDV